MSSDVFNLNTPVEAVERALQDFACSWHAAAALEVVLRSILGGLQGIRPGAGLAILEVT